MAIGSSMEIDLTLEFEKGNLCISSNILGHYILRYK